MSTDEREHSTAFNQKQEDLLLELFFQLSVDGRKRLIKVARDMVREDQSPLSAS